MRGILHCRRQRAGRRVRARHSENRRRPQRRRQTSHLRRSVRHHEIALRGAVRAAGTRAVARVHRVQRKRHAQAQQSARPPQEELMLPPDTVRTLAKRLYDARKSRTQLRHFSAQHPGMTVEDGYAIQREWVKLELADGRTIKGRKIGLTSRAMQQASQITEPDYAPLMDDMFFDTGGDIPFQRFIAPRVEVELAFV